MQVQSSAFTVWLDDFFSAYYRRRPVNATFIGHHQYDDQLPDFSRDGAGATVAEMETLLARLRTLPSEGLNQAEALDRKLAEGYLQTQLWEFESQHFHLGNPSLYTGEAIFGLLSLFLTDFGPFAERVESAIARMEAIPQLLAQGQANVRCAPLEWTDRAIRECTGALAFCQGGVEQLIHDGGIDGTRFLAAAANASTAFGEYQQYLESELRTQASDGYASGEEAFDLMMRQGHFVDMSAAEIVHRSAHLRHGNHHESQQYDKRHTNCDG
jgi:hypothetical protein